MPDASVIRIVDAYVEGLMSSVRTAAIDLGEGSFIPRVDFTSAPAVDHAWTAFYGRWNEHRDHLTDVLYKVAEALHTIQTKFQEIDIAYAQSLGDGESSIQGSTPQLQGSTPNLQGSK